MSRITAPSRASRERSATPRSAIGDSSANSSAADIDGSSDARGGSVSGGSEGASDGASDRDADAAADGEGADDAVAPPHAVEARVRTIETTRSLGAVDRDGMPHLRPAAELHSRQ